MARFGPSKAEVAAVEGWLTGPGLAVTKVSDEIGGYVGVRGSLAAAARAFDVTFGAYREDGVTVRAPQQTATAPAVPRGRRARRHRPGHRQPPGQARRHAARRRGRTTGWPGRARRTTAADRVPPSRRPTGSAAVHQLRVHAQADPRRLRRHRSGMTGKGQTVAVVDAYASPTMLSDANQYAQATGDKPFRAGPVHAGPARPPGRTPRRRVRRRRLVRRGVAGRRSGARRGPDAQRRVRGRCELHRLRPADALALIVDNHLASIVTDSWGEPYDSAALVPDLRPGVPGRRGRGHRVLLLLRRQRVRVARPRTPGRTRSRSTGRTRARTSPRSAAPAWRSGR